MRILVIFFLFFSVYSYGSDIAIFKPNVKRVSKDKVEIVMDNLKSSLENSGLKVVELDKVCSSVNCAVLEGDKYDFVIISKIHRIKKHTFIKFEIIDVKSKKILAKEAGVAISKKDVNKISKRVAYIVALQIPIRGTVDSIDGDYAKIKFLGGNIKKGKTVKFYEDANEIGRGTIISINDNIVKAKIDSGKGKIKMGVKAYYFRASKSEIVSLRRKMRKSTFSKKEAKRLKYHLKDYELWPNTPKVLLSLGYLSPFGSLNESFKCEGSSCEVSSDSRSAKYTGGVNFVIAMGFHFGGYMKFIPKKYHKFVGPSVEMRYIGFNKTYSDLKFTYNIFSTGLFYTYKPVYGIVKIGCVFMPYAGFMFSYGKTSGLDPRGLADSHSNPYGMGFEIGIKTVFRYFYITLAFSDPLLLPFSKETFVFKEDGMTRTYEYDYKIYSIYLSATFYMSVKDIKKLVFRSRR